MYAQRGFWIGDAWFFVDGETVHMYYLTQSLRERTSLGHVMHIGHAVSTNLRDWEYVGVAMSPGARGEWDDWRLATGSVLKWQDHFWMSYTGHHRMSEPFDQQCGIAVSDDLYKWDRIDRNPVAGPDGSIYEASPTGSRKHAPHWRDPFWVQAEDELVMLVCARRNEGDLSERGTVAVVRSKDMLQWELQEPVKHDLVGEEMEVPQAYFIAGKWYLVFCMHPFMVAESHKQKNPGIDWTPCDYCMVSDDLLGPSCVHGGGRIRGAAERGLYASQLICYKGRWYLIGMIENTISDPYVIEATGTDLRISTT